MPSSYHTGNTSLWVSPLLGHIHGKQMWFPKCHSPFYTLGNWVGNHPALPILLRRERIVLIYSGKLGCLISRRFWSCRMWFHADGVSGNKCHMTLPVSPCSQDGGVILTTLAPLGIMSVQRWSNQVKTLTVTSLQTVGSSLFWECLR